jgi:hypothetical protein
MGNAQSSVQKSIIDVYNESVTNIMISSSSSASASCKTNQSISIDGLDVRNCPFSVDQNSQTICDLKQMFSVENTNQLSTMMQSAVDNAAESKQKSVQDFMAASISVQSDYKDMQTYIKNIIRTNFSSSLAQACVAESSIDQTLTLRNIKHDCTLNPNKPQTYGQNAQLTQFAECLTNSIVDILKEDKVVNEVIQKAQSVQDSEQKGMSALLKALIGPLLIIAVVLIVFFVIFKQINKDSGGKLATDLAGKIPTKPM